MIIAGAALLIGIGQKTIATFAAVAAVLVFMVLAVPMSALSETALFLENAAPFTIFPVLCFAFLAPLFSQSTGAVPVTPRGILAGMAGLTLLFTVSALIVPAYSAAAPRSLTVFHSAGAGPGDAKWAVSGDDRLPATMTALAPFTRDIVHGLKDERYVAAAPDFETEGLDATIIRNERVGEEQLVTIEIIARDSDQLVGALEGDTDLLKSMRVNGLASAKPLTNSFGCYGRACRSMTLEIGFDPAVTELILELDAIRFGLVGRQSAQLLGARPDWALPIQTGDARIVSSAVAIVSAP